MQLDLCLSLLLSIFHQYSPLLSQSHLPLLPALLGTLHYVQFSHPCFTLVQYNDAKLIHSSYFPSTWNIYFFVLGDYVLSFLSFLMSATDHRSENLVFSYSVLVMRIEILSRVCY